MLACLFTIDEVEPMADLTKSTLTSWLLSFEASAAMIEWLAQVQHSAEISDWSTESLEFSPSSAASLILLENAEAVQRSLQP